jgi:hypothetical protein
MAVPGLRCIAGLHAAWRRFRLMRTIKKHFMPEFPSGSAVPACFFCCGKNGCFAD